MLCFPPPEQIPHRLDAASLCWLRLARDLWKEGTNQAYLSSHSPSRVEEWKPACWGSRSWREHTRRRLATRHPNLMPPSSARARPSLAAPVPGKPGSVPDCLVSVRWEQTRVFPHQRRRRRREAAARAALSAVSACLQRSQRFQMAAERTPRPIGAQLPLLTSLLHNSWLQQTASNENTGICFKTGGLFDSPQPW